ncbi:MAG: hypothetical protein JO250_18435, partial [Armatimonadetes bacterium]|nr:hypothetical protein [Armatimonadota bacterium]
MPQTHFDPNWWIAWLIPLFPLVGFVINGFWGFRLGKPASGALATLAVFASFLVACYLFTVVSGAPEGAKQLVIPGLSWMTVPMDPQGIHSLQINFELLVDPLSVLMMLIITGVGGLIHLYSMGYMAADRNYPRFFTYLNL